MRILGSAADEIANESGGRMEVYERSTAIATEHFVSGNTITEVEPSDVFGIIVMSAYDDRPQCNVKKEMLFSSRSPCKPIKNATFDGVRDMIRGLGLTRSDVNKVIDGKGADVSDKLLRRLTEVNAYFMMKEAGMDVGPAAPTLQQSKDERDRNINAIRSANLADRLDIDFDM